MHEAIVGRRRRIGQGRRGCESDDEANGRKHVANEHIHSPCLIYETKTIAQTNTFVNKISRIVARDLIFKYFCGIVGSDLFFASAAYCGELTARNPPLSTFFLSIQFAAINKTVNILGGQKKETYEMKLRYILISLFGLALTACSTPDVGANTPTKVSQVMAPVSNDHRPHIVEKFWMKNGHEQVDADLFLANVWDYVTDPTARANLVRRVELSTGLTELSLDQVASILRGEDNRFEVTAATCPDHIRVSDVGNNWGWRKPYVVNNHVEECVSINGDIAIAIGCANPVDNLIGQGLPVTTPSNPTITPTPTPTPCAGCGEQPPVDVCIGGPLDCDGEPPVEKPCVGETEDCGGEKPPVVKEPQPKPEKCTKECNNGWGNGDQEAPGHSLPHNGAENDQTNRRPDPSHGQNAGSNGKGKK